MEHTVEQVFEAIQRHELVPAKDLATLKSRWFEPNRKEVNDSAKFGQWLVANHYVTRFAVGVLGQGKAYQLVFNQYKVRDRLTAGPLAGAFLASDPRGRSVALEVLTPEIIADPAITLAIFQVVQKAIQVDHLNVGRILELGEAHGMHYLVKEHYDGETLASILQRRGKLPYLQAARLFALALAGLQALHEQDIPGGDLTPECLILTSAGPGAQGQRTVKILHAGLRRRLFDSAALTGKPEAFVADDLSASVMLQAPSTEKLQPEADIFRLGCTFYWTLTGQPPFAAEQLPEPAGPARPVNTLAPDVPAMLAQIVEAMIDPVASQRPPKAANVSKVLRIFLGSEEESPKTKPEEFIALPTSSQPASAAAAKPRKRTQPMRPARAEPEPESEPEEEPVEEPPSEEPAPEEPAEEIEEELSRKKKASSLRADIWEIVRPQERDVVYLAFGVFLIVILMLVLNAVSGLEVINLVCLLAGVAVAFVVETFIRWRARRRE